MLEHILASLPSDPDRSAVLSVNARVVAAADRWAVQLSVVMMPDRDDYVVEHCVGDFASRSRATIAAISLLHRAERHICARPA
jgi:hypothetical protein